jgi:hypothetical protein
MFKNNIQYQTLNLKKGGCLFHQGANIERLFFLEKGRVKLVRNTIEGRSPAKGGSIILTLPSSRLIRGTLTCRFVETLEQQNGKKEQVKAISCDMSPVL